MNDEISHEDRPSPAPAILSLLVGFGFMIAAGIGIFVSLRPSSTPPPTEIANDPLLVEGRTIFLDRCATCHGQLGKGDGTTAKVLTGPPVRDLTDPRRKHGDQPGQVLAVVRDGVKDTQMPGFQRSLSEDAIKAVTAYVFHLGGTAVPEPLRAK